MNGPFRREGVAGPERQRALLAVLAGASILLIALVSAACGSGPSATSGSPGFAGYDWQVVAISHDGMEMAIPARLQVALQFSRDGHFGANDGVNTSGGTYRATDDGFMTSALSTTLIGYAGHDPAVLLAMKAIASFGNGGHATVRLTGDRLVVGIGSYTLTCRRHGLAPTPPPPGNSVPGTATTGL
jgi:heat shock protein HslJ